MKLYKGYAPTGFDHKGAFGLPGDHLVPDVSQTRDSGPLEQSNFAAFAKSLDDAGIEYETHRFGHWGPGWIEILLVAPTEAAEALIEELEGALENYPVLDEEDLGEREMKLAEEVWRNCYNLRERIRIICEHGDGNIFAARRDYPPNDPTGAIQEYLIRD